MSGLIVSIDSGSNEFGWCAVHRAGARATFVDGGTAPATRAGFLEVIERARCVVAKQVGRGEPSYSSATTGVIYIETPDGFVHEPFRGPHLLTTSRLVGGIVWEAERLGIRSELRTAGWWRKALVGQASSPKRGKMDQLVAAAVRSNIIDMPASSNVHIRDALGLAIVACWELSKGRAA